MSKRLRLSIIATVCLVTGLCLSLLTPRTPGVAEEPASAHADDTRKRAERSMAAIEGASSPKAAKEPRTGVRQSEVLREPEFFPRDPDEWQGMRVDVTHPMDCERPDGCNIGMACINGTCAACTADVQCPRGEVCTMDHCIPADNRKCRARKDCGKDELCFLNGFDGTSPRMNENMVSYCAPTTGKNPYAKGPDTVDETDVEPPEPSLLGPAYEMADEVLKHSQELARSEPSPKAPE